MNYHAQFLHNDPIEQDVELQQYSDISQVCVTHFQRRTVGVEERD